MDHAKKLAEALRPFVTGPVMHDKTLGDTRLVQAAQIEAAQAALAAYDAAPAWTPPEDGLFIIFKQGRGFYRPNAQGYTMNTLDAGRFTRAEAMAHTYPNGPEGSRDGLDFMPAPLPGDA